MQTLDSQRTATADEPQREAYNAAFYELGLRWHWDSETFEQLRRAGDAPAAALRHYLQTRQAALLRAYDIDFLVQAIEAAAARALRAHSAARRFDWAQSLGRELGA